MPNATVRPTRSIFVSKSFDSEERDEVSMDSSCCNRDATRMVFDILEWRIPKAEDMSSIGQEDFPS